MSLALLYIGEDKLANRPKKDELVFHTRVFEPQAGPKVTIKRGPAYVNAVSV